MYMLSYKIKDIWIFSYYHQPREYSRKKAPLVKAGVSEAGREPSAKDLLNSSLLPILNEDCLSNIFNYDFLILPPLQLAHYVFGNIDIVAAPLALHDLSCFILHWFILKNYIHIFCFLQNFDIVASVSQLLQDFPHLSNRSIR